MPPRAKLAGLRHDRISRRALVALPALALLLGGCETTAEKSAQLEHAAKLRERVAQARDAAAARALAITKPSSTIKVVSCALVRGSEGDAAVVSLRNVSASAMRDVPVAIAVRDARGAVLYRNTVAGQQPALLMAGFIPPHGELRWVDDQVQASAAAAGVSAEVGEGQRSAGSSSGLSVGGARRFEDPTSGPGEEGSVLNASAASMSEVLVYGVALRGGRVLAAGRAVVPQVPAHGSARFQLFFTGDPSGGQLSFSAQPAPSG